MLHILHNPRCGKSRNCLAFVNETNKKFEVINYLDNPLSVEEIKSLLIKLNMKPIELIRQKESIWIEKFKGKPLSDDDILLAMAKHPILIERPIVIDGDKAAIGRDLENLKNLLG